MRENNKHLNIAILDNDVLALQMLHHSISSLASDFNVSWCSKSATEMLYRCFTENSMPDVLIVDMALADIPGPQVCHYIRQRTSKIGLVGITAYPVKLYIEDLINAGAQALIPKERIGQLGNNIIRRASLGLPQDEDDIFLRAEDAHSILVEEKRSYLPLTRREKEILLYFAKGIPTEEIQKELNISRNTIFTHTHRALKKLHARNRAEALAICAKYSLLNTENFNQYGY